jgi:endonuclease/exonuclease/phosphatase (EEP) superfamily protein YafD
MSRVTLAVAFGCLTASLTAQAGRWVSGFDVIAQVAPLLAFCSASVAILAPWTRRPWRGAVGAVGILGLAASGALLVPELSRPTPGGQPTPGAARLRVIQINLGGGGLQDPQVAARWLADQHPDLVFVDDVDPGLRAALERQGFFWRKGTAWTAIASRHPTLHTLVPFSGRDWRTMPDMARATYETPQGPVDLLAVHLKRPFHASEDQGAALADLTVRYDRRRLILAGDLNLTPWSFALHRLDRSLGLERRDRAAFTWPARVLGMDWPAPFLPLDHLYAGPGWRTLAVTTGPAIGATHRPLVVDLEAAPVAQGRRDGQRPRSATMR